MNKFLRYSFIGLLAVLFANVSAQDINTCADVIAGEDGVTFRIKGECTEIKNTTFGNWMLKDATGEVYIYGTLDAEGKIKNFGSLGIEVGDIVTVEGPKKTYNTTVELVDVTVIAIEKGSSPDNPDPQPSGEVKEGDDCRLQRRRGEHRSMVSADGCREEPEGRRQIWQLRP